MHKLVLTLVLAGLLLGCGGDNGFGAILKKGKAFKERTCACKDQACLDGVEQEMQAWFEKAVAKFEGKPSKDQEEQWDKIEAEAEACSDKIKEAEREKQGAASLAVMKKLKDEMCACADEACSDKVHDKLTEQWKTDARVAPTDAQAQEISAITEEISKCRLNAIAPGAIPPADPAAAPAPPVP